MVTVVLACALVAGFRVPAEWTFDRIDLAAGETPSKTTSITAPDGINLDMYTMYTCEASRLRVYLHREIEPGKTVDVPADCKNAVFRFDAVGGDKVRVVGKRRKPDNTLSIKNVPVLKDSQP